MKGSISGFLLFAAVAVASADQFQIKERTGGDAYNVSYAEIRIPNVSPPFRGTTDGYGRITVNLQPGQYTAEVYAGTQMKGRVSLTVDNPDVLETVYLEALVH